jgi:hypothetical protein
MRFGILFSDLFLLGLGHAQLQTTNLDMNSELRIYEDKTISQHAVIGLKRSQLCLMKPVLMAMGLVMMMVTLGQPVYATGDGQTVFKRIRTQFIAALGDPDASSGSDAQSWGLWRRDPGPRGIRLGNYEQLKAAGGVAPAQWEFDSADWWVEENGLIMEQPDFPLPPGKYLVTGDRETVSALTVHPMDQDGAQRWELANGARLYDVTHLPCRSARYTPATSYSSCSPGKVKTRFPVTPGKPMPSFEGCNKQDYAVLFVIAVAVGN